MVAPMLKIIAFPYRFYTLTTIYFTKIIDFILKLCDNNFMKKIGILGGTFDPVHIEHVSLAKSAIEELGLDKILIMPTFLPPHKSLIPANAEDRLNMLKIAFKDVEKAEISDYEIKKEGKSYTYATVEHIKSTCECDLYFIVGGDMLTDFKNWRYPERILDACTLAVFSREDFFTDYSAEEEYFLSRFGKKFIRLSYLGGTVSSTKIRTYASFSISLAGQVDKGVEEYIKEKGLYSGDKYTEFIKKTLPPKRIRHTADVVWCALKKAKELKLDTEKVRIASTLHDCAKYLDHSTVQGFSLDNDVPPPVVHAFLGAFVAEKMLGVNDVEILDAIRYHTSGKANMTLLSKLIFVADMVEEGRTYEGVEKLRKLYEKDFGACFIECLKEEFIHLLNKKQHIYAETINAFRYYIDK